MKSAALTDGWLCIISNQKQVALKVVHLVFGEVGEDQRDQRRGEISGAVEELKGKLCSTQVHITREGSGPWIS